MLDTEINFIGNGEDVSSDVLNRPLEDIRENLLVIFDALGNQTFDKSSSGFEKHANGIVYRWGEATIAGDGYITFDSAFDNECFIVHAGNVVSPAGLPYISIGECDVSGFYVKTYSDISTLSQNQFTFKYLAIGH